MAQSSTERVARHREKQTYVDRQVALTKLQIDRGQIHPLDSDEVLARSKSYALWRWAGYHDGSIVSL